MNEELKKEAISFRHSYGFDSGDIERFIDRATLAERKKILDSVKEFFTKETGYKGVYIEPVKPSHGSCCTCQDCGYENDECACENNRIFDFLTTIEKDV